MTFLRPDGNSGVLIAIKAVPGASRDEIAGVLGDRLKIRVAAPPEDGKANDAIRRLLAATLGVPFSAVEITAGQSKALKSVRVTGCSVAQASARLSRS